MMNSIYQWLVVYAYKWWGGICPPIPNWAGGFYVREGIYRYMYLDSKYITNSHMWLVQTVNYQRIRKR